MFCSHPVDFDFEKAGISFVSGFYSAFFFYGRYSPGIAVVLEKASADPHRNIHNSCCVHENHLCIMYAWRRCEIKLIVCQSGQKVVTKFFTY